MPAVSKAQFKFMSMIAHNPSIAKQKGLSQEKAKEFISQNNYSKLPEKKRKSKTLSKMK